MIQRQRLFLVVGIVMALLSVFMVKVYLDQQRQLMQEQAKRDLSKIQANQTAVLVAKKDIPRGVVIASELLEVAIVPHQYVQPQAVTSLDRISGMFTAVPISKGEHITLSKLIWSKEAARGSLAMATPVGKRAITISVDNIAALAGMIKPGDYVDVIVFLPVPVQTPEGKPATQIAVMPLFQNILVLAVGQETGVIPTPESESRYKKEEKKEISSLITLALGPQETNLIAFVQEQGKIRLVLRSPADSQIQPVQPASWETVFQYVMPQEAAKPEAKKEEPREIGFVEIYRGLNKEKVPLYK